MIILLVVLWSCIAALGIVSYVNLLYNCLRKARVVTVSPNNTTQTIAKYPQAPGPLPWPIVGNLALLGRYKVPFVGFTEMAKEFGDAYSLTLGSTRCLIVNNLELIREVLNQNGKLFGGRPDFLRYNKLFGGDRNNSLALCDWTHLQQKRRNLARRHCSPRDRSSYFTKMSNIGCMESSELMDRLKEEIVPGVSLEIKPLIQQTCANMFSQYMCTVRFDYDDHEFCTIVKYFDEIFWEINQGYAIDFLPWLAPFYKKHTDKLIGWSTAIRKFILERVIVHREHVLDLDEPENDFTDALLKSLAEDNNVSRDTIIFMLEDFIGGHSAVGNLVMLTLAYIVKYPHVGFKIQEEADKVANRGNRKINLYDMEAMPYTLATIFEVLRYSSSPIVPHVATEDIVISGHGVTSGTVVFINNYKLNTSEQYWINPGLFNPERFLEKTEIFKRNNVASKPLVKRRNSEGSDSGIEFERDACCTTTSVLHDANSEDITNHIYQRIQVKKNIPHFLPFSIGKRTCIGQNLVRGFSFILLTNILQRYDVSSQDHESIIVNPACVALPAKTFPLVFTERSPNY